MKLVLLDLIQTNNLMLSIMTGTSWKAIDAPPTVSSISPSSYVSDGSTVVEITISGSGFSNPPANIIFVGADNTEYTATNQTYDSATQVKGTVTTNMTAGNGPYAVKVVNVSGLSGTLATALTAGNVPTFATSSGNIGTLFSNATVFTGLSSIKATDADGQELDHSITSGSLPSGMTMDENGNLFGTAPNVGSSTDSTFTVTATDGLNTASRSFTITVAPPPFISASGGTITEDGDFKVHTFNSTDTFTVANVGADPTYGTVVEYLVVGGGGGPGQSHGGGGGAGGYRHNSAYSMTVSATSYSVTVGTSPNNQSNGGASSFNSIQSAGGGYGGNNNQAGNSGGSGGGGGSHPGGAGGGGGNSPSVSPSQGNSGGSGSPGGPRYGTGGGGGAGGSGGHGNANQAGSGGSASTNDISGTSLGYAGGGGGHGHGGGAAGGSGIGGHGSDNSPGANAVPNRGGGAGGQRAATGSDGVVVIRYKFQ
jgi:hypothetical protein